MEVIKINSRLSNIIHNIVNNKLKSLVDYSEMFDVSQRTIRNDIKEMNEILKQNNHQPIVVNESGKLCFMSPDEVDNKLIDRFFNNKDFYSYKLSPNERKTILAQVLLNTDGYITIATLSEHMFTSRNTLLNDLDELKDWFSENNLELSSLRSKGFTVLGTEKNIRDGMLKLLLLNGEILFNSGEDKNLVFHQLLIRELDKENIFKEIEYILDNMEEKNDLCLTDYSYRDLAYYILIMVYRLMNNKVLGKDSKTDINKIKNSSKYIIASQLMEILSKRYNFPILHQEIAELIVNLSSKSYIKNNSKCIDMFDIQILISEFIYKISAELEINYYLDFYLYDLLVEHMKIAVNRLKQGHSIENPLYSQLIAKYPYVFEEVKKYIKSLEEYIKHQFTNDEISFIVMYIVSVMEKNKSKAKALIVCNSGQGTAQLISARLQSLCKQLEIVNVISSHNLKSINEDNVDIIISTVPLKDVNLPLVEVSPILTDDDFYKTQSMIIKIQDEKQKYRCTIQKLATEKKQERQSVETDITFKSERKFIDIISADRIKLDIDACDWQDAIRQAGNELLKDNKIKQSYIEAMIDNIKTNGPYVVIYPGIAIPHAASSDGSIELAASLIRLKNPVRFNHVLNDPVKYIIALSITESESIDRLLYNLTKMLGTESFITMMNDIDTPDKLYHILENSEKKI
ncbi:MAG: hypothetical protein APF77_00530 [Clostridia bacterium BRH_c25]|nr:MAG: hypothetical protein APF77_00530 [Clostridia bacterium BRH_c25]